jgi:hypothetical protein
MAKVPSGADLPLTHDRAGLLGAQDAQGHLAQVRPLALTTLPLRVAVPVVVSLRRQPDSTLGPDMARAVARSERNGRRAVGAAARWAVILLAGSIAGC